MRVLPRLVTSAFCVFLFCIAVVQVSVSPFVVLFCFVVSVREWLCFGESYFLQPSRPFVARVTSSPRLHLPVVFTAPFWLKRSHDSHDTSPL